MITIEVNGTTRQLRFQKRNGKRFFTRMRAGCSLASAACLPLETRWVEIVGTWALIAWLFAQERLPYVDWLEDCALSQQ